MKFKLNIIANYVNLIYTTLIGILVMPLFFDEMGAEAFGLIGFYSLLQTWFVLMDLGLSASLSRECAKFLGGSVTGDNLRKLLRSVECIFLAAAFIGISIVVALSLYIANEWLNLEQVSVQSVATSIKIMSIVVGLRWMSGLYRGVLNGFEMQVWTSNFGILISTLRFPLAYLFVKYIDSGPVAFFLFQLLIAIIELALIRVKSERAMPNKLISIHNIVDFSAIKSLIKFSLSISFLSIVTSLITQIDKVILSRIMRLDEYGEFSLIVVLSGGIVLLAGPVGSAVIPRLSRFCAELKYFELLEVYKKSTMLTSIIVFSAAMFMAAMSKEIIYAWTGSIVLAQKLHIILTIYAFANSFYVLSSFPHYLQFAFGDMRIQIRFSLIMLMLSVPALIVFSISYGAVGAAWVWFGVSMLGFIVNTAIVHRKFINSEHFAWLKNDVLPFFIIALITSYAIQFLIEWSSNRSILIAQLIVSATTILFSSILISDRPRSLMFVFLRKIQNKTTAF